jgi:hypothetical protein
MAATTHTWTNGNADGDWNNIANWDTGQVPGAGGPNVDTVIFDGTQTNTGPDTNMDRSADNVLFRIVVKDNFTGTIGGSGNPLIHSVNTATGGYILHRGSGRFDYKVDFGELARVVIDGRGTMTVDCESTAQVNGLYIKRGTVTVASTCELPYEVMLDSGGADLTVAAADGAEASPATVIVNGGTFTNNRTVAGTDHITVLAGKLVQTGLIADSATIIIGPHGRVKYTPSGTLGAGHNPKFVVCGLLDTGDSNQDIVPELLVISELGNLQGTSVQPGYSTYVDLDLREEYP